MFDINMYDLSDLPNKVTILPSLAGRVGMDNKSSDQELSLTMQGTKRITG